MRCPRLLTTTAAVALAAGVGATGVPAAGAAVPRPPHRVVYDVTISGLGTYERHDHFGDQNDPSFTSNDLNFDFSYTSTYQDVVFVDGRLESVRIAPEQDGGIQVHEAKIEHRDNQGAITETILCKANARIETEGDGSLEQDPIVGLGSERLMFRPADVLAAAMDCDDADPSANHEGSHLGADLAHWGWSATGPAELGEGPLDMNFDLPYEALGMGYIEHPVDPAPEQLEGPHCPGFTLAVTQTCKLQWTGTVQMTKVGGDGPAPGTGTTTTSGTAITPADIPLPPKPGPAPAPAPAPRPATGTAPSVGAGRLARDRRHVAFTVRCPGPAPCRGTAKAPGGKAQAFAVPAGRTRTITIALARRPRRGTATAVAVSVTPRGGAPVRRSLKVRG